MANVVTDYLVQLLAKQVEERSLVVWYDPEKAYGKVVAGLKLPKTTIAVYEGSFFRLRREIDHLMNDSQPPRLVVYVPEEQGMTHNALIELEAAGIVMQPGQQPPARNTRLAVVARNALKPILGDDQVGEIERQAENGKLTLADLNALAEKGKDISTGMLTLIFGSANPQELALAFLHDDRFDAELDKKSAQKQLQHLLQVSFNLDLPESASLTDIRQRLTRHVLITDLVASLSEHVPSALSSIKVAITSGGVDACVRLTRSWRNNRDVRDSYVDAANKVEQDFSLGKLAFEAQNLVEAETFLAVERAILRYVENELLKAATPKLLQTAVHRLSRFWADVVPAIQARWALVATAAEVLIEADRVAKEIKSAPTNFPALVHAYAQDDEPWCLLDTHHRHMESRWYNFDSQAGDDHDSLGKLVVKAEQRYTAVGSELAKLFVAQFQKTKYPIKGLLRQREIFETQVRPKFSTGKVAYVWVDALRFEMARELGRLLKNDFDVTLQPGIATPPTITEIGMAALLPKAQMSAKVVPLGGGRLGLEIEGTIIRDRKDRVAFLKQNCGVSVFEAKLDDLLPRTSKRVTDGIQGAELVLITSQEIDELCEADNISQARLQMDGVLSHLRRGVRVLADQGIKTIVLVADHGHLFADELGDDMKIDAPGGKSEDLHRRVWVGLGGSSESSFMRAPLSSLGIESDLDLATPWTFACFKSRGGARAYFHGGLSPQELIIPVMTLLASVPASRTSTAINWTLTTGTAKLTTRFFSVQVAGTQEQSGLFELEAPKVRIEIRANKKAVSVPVSASYGFEDATGEVALKISSQDSKRVETNTITVMVAEEINQKTVSILLLDASTGAELAELDGVEVAISM